VQGLLFRALFMRRDQDSGHLLAGDKGTGVVFLTVGARVVILGLNDEPKNDSRPLISLQAAAGINQRATAIVPATVCGASLMGRVLELSWKAPAATGSEPVCRGVLLQVSTSPARSQ
jgi:hypothetical protein